MRIFWRVAAVILFVFIVHPLAFAETIESLRIIDISAKDQRAVVKCSDNTLKIIKLGDKLGVNGKVVEIASGRVMIEEKTPNGPEMVIVRLEKGNQSLQRIKKTADRHPMPVAVGSIDRAKTGEAKK